MMNATEMRNTAKMVIENARRERFEKAKNFCEEELAKAIEYEANLGEFSTPAISVPHNIEINDVMNYLKSNGYEVKNSGMSIVVKW